MKKFNFRKNKAFTVLELMIAIFIILTALLAGIYTISGTLAATSVYKHQLIAAYLAQEGIELVRNIRDKNWIEGENWNKKLDAGDWQADYTTTVLQSSGAPCTVPQFYNCHSYLGDFLKISTTSPQFYNHTSGTDTPFKRKITLSYPDVDTLEVSVTVFWQDRGSSYEFPAQEKIYNWKE